jgi:hypothetical protein
MLAGTGVLGIAVAAPVGASTTVKVNCPTDDLQAVINAAAPGSTLVVTGTCAPLGPNASFSILKNLTLVGPATLQGDQAGTVLVVGGGAAVVLNSITITGGTPVGVDVNGGGGITNGADGSGSSVTLNRSSVTSNTNQSALGFGLAAGIYNDGILILNSSSVGANFVYSYLEGAGGIYNDVNGNATLNKSSVFGNYGVSLAAGIENAGTLTVNNSTVTGNVGNPGVGGIDNAGSATVNHSSVTGNLDLTGLGVFPSDCVGVVC